MAQARMNKANRIVALVLALIWITGGGLGIALGLRHNKWLFVLAEGSAIFYGLGSVLPVKGVN